MIFYLGAQVASYQVEYIILAIPFAVLMGFAFARLYSNRIVKAVVFLFFTITSPLTYPLLIISTLLHITLLTGIVCITALHTFLVRLSVQQAMIIVGVILIVVGAGLQFASTF